MIKKFILFTSLALVATIGYAQKAPLVITVDMSKLYSEYWKAQEAEEKFQSSVQNAQAEIQLMLDEGMALAKELQEMQDKLNNPAVSEEAKESTMIVAQEKANLIRQKETELNRYRQETDRTLQQRRQSILNLHLAEIRDVVVDVAKEKGADLVLNTNGMVVVYFDPAFDVTDDVITKLNSTKPQE